MTKSKEPLKLNRLQSKNLLGRLYQLRERVCYDEDEEEPAEVTKARAIVDKWETSTSRSQRRKRNTLELRFKRAETAVLFAKTSEAAIAAVEAFEKEFPPK